MTTTRTNHTDTMTTADMIRALSTLAGEMGHALYMRAKYAHKILSDRQWVDARYKGDDHKAAEWLEKEHFRDLCGLVHEFGVISLSKLYETFPDEIKWQDADYNIRILLTEYHNIYPVEKKERATKQRATLAMLEEKEEEIKRLIRENAQLQEQLNQAKQRIHDLERLIKAMEGTSRAS